MKNMNFTYYVGMLFCVLFLATKTTANDIDLCTYAPTPNVISISEITQNLSGVTYNPVTNTLFMVSNGPLNIYETELDGTWLRTISLNGFYDTEGIVYIREMTGASEFAVTDEKTRRITFINIFPTTTSITASNNYIQIPNDFEPWGSDSNKSLEGVSYNPATNTIYTVKEGKPADGIDKGFYAIERPASLPATPGISDIDQLCNIAQNPYGLGDLAGMHHLRRTFTGNTGVLLLSEANETLIHLDENCNEIGRLLLNTLFQPEGVTMDNSGNIYIVGEPNELAVITPSLDTDADGVCDPNDVCPNFDDNLIGTACDDGDDCTTGETYDTSCNCTDGIFQDADGDNVCDANDICPNGDDNIDTDGDGIPDACETSTCRQTDSLALIAVYNALNGNTWQEHLQWDFTQSMDTWQGVRFNESGCVDKLDLIERSNVGSTIAPEIGDLSEITGLNLSKNNINGGIPSEIGNLTNLEILNLDYNNITGMTSTFDNLSALKLLYLRYNNLVGINASVGGLTNLIGLYLDHNKIVGINSAISSLTNLKYLYVSNNNIGGIPAEIGDLTNLERLYLSHNNIGGIPAEIGTLTNLKRLYLNHNNIGGIPAEIGDLTNLERLYLNTNNMGGIPAEIGNLSNLKFLNLDHNNIGGLPLELGDLANLERLYIRYNNIGGIPATIGGLSKLQLLYLSHNNIVGINPAVGNLTNLVGLYLNHNNITGINPAVGNLTNLKDLFLSYNNLAGVNPAVGNLVNLTRLRLNDNQISGRMPAWLADMDSLEELKLHKNNMSGCFDSNLSSLCSQLTTASINYGNNFTIEWADFCNGASCDGAKIGQNQAIDTQNFPNPFTNQTTITYTLPEDSPVTLTIYNGAGKQVALLHDDTPTSAGTHSINFEGGAYPAGLYYYTIQAGTYSGTQKMILMR